MKKVFIVIIATIALVAEVHIIGCTQDAGQKASENSKLEAKARNKKTLDSLEEVVRVLEESNRTLEVKKVVLENFKADLKQSYPDKLIEVTGIELISTGNNSYKGYVEVYYGTRYSSSVEKTHVRIEVTTTDGGDLYYETAPGTLGFITSVLSR